MYVHSAVKNYWMTDQQEIISKIKDEQAAKKNAILAGDTRCDSLGSSAKYCV